MARKTNKTAAPIPSVPEIVRLVEARYIAGRIIGSRVSECAEVRVGEWDGDKASGKQYILYRAEPPEGVEYEFEPVAELPEGYDAYLVQWLQENYSEIGRGWWIGPKDAIDEIRRLDQAIDDAMLALCDRLESRGRPGVLCDWC